MMGVSVRETFTGILKLCSRLAQWRLMALTLASGAAGAKVDFGADDLAEQKIIFSPYASLNHVLKLEERVFNFARMHLFAADIDDIGFSAKNADIRTILLDFVSGDVPAVFRKRRRRIQIPQHRCASFDLKYSVNDPMLCVALINLEK